MSHRRLMFAAASVCFVVLSACAATPDSASASGSGSLGAAPGATAAASAAASAASKAPATTDMVRAKATFESVCSSCHEPDLAADLRNTREGWQQLIDRMFGFGLAANAQQVAEIVDYLSYTYPAE